MSTAPHKTPTSRPMRSQLVRHVPKGAVASHMSDLSEQKATVSDAEIKLAVDRTRLAYDRTMLSWVRTATALITFGFSIEEFFRIARKGAVERTGFIGPHELGRRWSSSDCWRCC